MSARARIVRPASVAAAAFDRCLLGVVLAADADGVASDAGSRVVGAHTGLGISLCAAGVGAAIAVGCSGSVGIGW